MTTEHEQKLEQVGGVLWEKNGFRRVYFNNLPELFGRLDCGFYNTGNVSSARLDGERISNTRASGILGVLNNSKFWYDLNDHKFHLRSESTCRDFDNDEILYDLVSEVQKRISQIAVPQTIQGGDQRPGES